VSVSQPGRKRKLGATDLGEAVPDSDGPGDGSVDGSGAVLIGDDVGEAVDADEDFAWGNDDAVALPAAARGGVWHGSEDLIIGTQRESDDDGEGEEDDDDEEEEKEEEVEDSKGASDDDDDDDEGDRRGGNAPASSQTLPSHVRSQEPRA
jgi:hypothetical protein